MKKMLFSAALAMLITGCAQQTFTVGNKPTAVTPKETITWICPYISRHLLSLNPLQARCRRYSRGER